MERFQHISSRHRIHLTAAAALTVAESATVSDSLLIDHRSRTEISKEHLSRYTGKDTDATTAVRVLTSSVHMSD